MISVIIPYYNPDGNPSYDTLLHRAINSAISNLEGLTTYEILLINDGSNREPVIEEYNPGVLRYFHRPHGRLGAARNYGIEQAQGDILTFLDADDFYLPDSLEPCIEAMSHLDADLLGFGMRRTTNITGTDNPRKGKPSFEGPMTGNEYMKKRNLPGSACRYLISAELIRRNGLRFMENAYIEDEEFTPRMVYLSQRFVNTDFPVYAYCVHPGTITTSSSKVKADEKTAHTLLALKHLLCFRDEHIKEPHEGIDRKISYLCLDLQRRTLRRKDWKEVIGGVREELTGLGLVSARKKGYSLGFRIYTLLLKSRTGQHLLHILEKFYT